MDEEGWEIARIMSAAFIGTIILMVAIFAGHRYVEHHYSKASCNAFGLTSGREVRFVDYTFWSWDCLTPASDGKWISIDNLREIK